MRRLLLWPWHLLRDSWRFLRAKPVRIVIVALPALLGAALGVYPGNAAYQYTWADYRFCDDCHVHDYANEAYARSVHFGLTTCHDCHRVPIRHYPRNLYMAIFDRPQTEDDIHPPDVESVICEQCHSSTADEPLTGPMPEEVRAHVVKIDHSPLHQTHLRSTTRDPGPYRGHHSGSLEKEDHGTEAIGGHHAEPAYWDAGVITCMDCHGSDTNRAHRFEAQRDNCKQCHGDVSVGSGRLEHISCQECHFSGFAGVPGDGVEPE